MQAQGCLENSDLRPQTSDLRPQTTKTQTTKTQTTKTQTTKTQTTKTQTTKTQTSKTQTSKTQTLFKTLKYNKIIKYFLIYLLKLCRLIKMTLPCVKRGEFLKFMIMYAVGTTYLLRLPFTLSGVFSFPYVTPLIRIRYPQTYISMESLWNYLNDDEKIN